MKDTTKIVFPICRTCSKVHLCFMSDDTKDKCKKYAEYKSDVEIAQKGRAIPGEGGRMTVKEIIKKYLIDNGFDYDVTGYCYKTKKPVILPETNEEMKF